MKISLQVIPQVEQRYETLGDYWLEEKTETLHIRVSKFPFQEHELAVAVHELVEAWLCIVDGVDISAIDKFDMAWKPHDGLTEPGDDKQAPYYEQHQVATTVEKKLIEALGLRWEFYESECDEVLKEKAE